MANVINATSTGNGGLISTGDDSGILNIQTNETTAITVDTSQNVGIGLTPTAYKLSTNVASGDNTFGQYVGSTLYGYLQTSSSYVKLGTNAATPVIVETNGTERMRIDSSGNLLVGQTSQTGNEKFGVTQSGASSFAAYFNATAGNYGYDVVKIRCARGSATNEYNFINCLQVSTLVFQVQANGNVQNTNNSYGAISDIKLKENIVDATPKLADLMQVKVRNYNLKSDPTHKQLGVIAQELEQVFPAMVEEATDKDEEGNILETTTKSVKYSVFVPMLIKAIQEQQALIDTQAETINALTARIVALEGQ